MDCDVVVVGGGPTGIAAATAAARLGARVALIERFPYLGGMASGGQVLLLDDMASEGVITVKGLAQEIIDRMQVIGLAVAPPSGDRTADDEAIRRWARWGFQDPYSSESPKPVTYAAAFDPEGWKLAANSMVTEAGVIPVYNSWFVAPILDGKRLRGVVARSKSGETQYLANVVIDASGDADVALSAGASVRKESYLVSLVFRLGGVDTRTAEDFEYENEELAAHHHKTVRKILGGAWARWWLRTPIDSVVWCNCPHFTGIDGIGHDGLTSVEIDGRERIFAAVAYARENIPGFEKCFVLAVAPQIGIRQSRLLEGEYVVTKRDILDGRYFEDSVARGRNYFTPYRAILPRDLDQLLVPGRHYSAEPTAQRISREIPPCMAMGEAAGVAAAISLDTNSDVRGVDVGRVRQVLVDQGADPGDPSHIAAPIGYGGHLEEAAAIDTDGMDV